MPTLLLIVSIILIIMSLLLMIAVPIAGAAGALLGVVLIIVSRNMKKKAMAEAEKAARLHETVRQNAAKYAESKKIGQCYIAGLYHHKTAVKAVLDGEDYFSGPCQLIPEPNNKVDPNAIRIEINGRHVGYVPAKMCESVHKIIPQIVSCSADIETNDDGDLSGEVTMYGG